MAADPSVVFEGQIESALAVTLPSSDNRSIWRFFHFAGKVF
jgi:hypothetical protein